MSTSLLKFVRPSRCLTISGYYLKNEVFHSFRNLEAAPLRCYNLRYQSTEKKSNSSLSNVKYDSDVSPSVKETVKEASKTVSYLGVIIFGISVTSVVFYAIFRELFSRKSPNSVYSHALDKCCADNRVKDALGEPIKGFGEETRRGRRRHVSHAFYEKDGVKYLRMKFYVKGIRKQGTVHLEMKEDSSGDFNYRYLFLELDDYSNRVIVLEDNRSDAIKTYTPTPIDQFDLSTPLKLS